MSRLIFALLLFMGSIFFVNCKRTLPTIETLDVGSIDKDSGLIVDTNLNLVKAHCTACHSAKYITMNRFSREGWLDKIRWMQKTQNLWDLGESEPAVLDYLAKYYSPENKPSRRKSLDKIEWYLLELSKN